jgi:hypothetical protein
MKNKEESENNFQYSITPEPLSGITEKSATLKVERRLRKLFYIVSLIGIGLSINACTSTGYVETEPAYVEYSRPPQPSNNHIWINGDWQYNQQNHVYVQKNGYWEKPSNRRTHVSGHWEKGPQGSYWVTGHYQRNRR